MGRGARAQRPNEASEAMARGARLKQTVASAYVGAHGEKYTDEALAQKAGVSVNTVRNLWQGRNAEISTLIGVASASGMSILDLFTAMQGSPTGQGAERRAGERRVTQADAATVAAAIDRQTEMLRGVLERMAPVEAAPPDAGEAAAVEAAEAERDRRAADTRHPAGRQGDGVE